MALRCDNCGKGKEKGHMVSHAKNRKHRFFRPNLQKLKASVRGMITHVKLCTRCIKRLKKDGKIGIYTFVSPIKDIKKKVLNPIPVAIKVEIKVPEKKKSKPLAFKKKVKSEKTLDISSIVGSKVS
jgi:large subunit ribosomal protein L28